MKLIIIIQNNVKLQSNSPGRSASHQTLPFFEIKTCFFSKSENQKYSDLFFRNKIHFKESKSRPKWLPYDTTLDPIRVFFVVVEVAGEKPTRIQSSFPLFESG